jgi:hypothetical protein
MCESVLTHTRPWPPPGAGGLVAVSVLVLFAGARLAAAGLAAAELFGLNRSPSLNLAGDGDAAGLAAAAAFLRTRFAAGDAAGEGDAAVSADDAVVWVFFCFPPAGDSPGVGDCAWTAQAVASPIAKKRVRNLLVMEASLNKPRDYSQRISSEQTPFSAQKTAKPLRLRIPQRQ